MEQQKNIDRLALDKKLKTAANMRDENMKKMLDRLKEHVSFHFTICPNSVFICLFLISRIISIFVFFLIIRQTPHINIWIGTHIWHAFTHLPFDKLKILNRINWQSEQLLMLAKMKRPWKNCTFSKINFSLPNKIEKKKYRKNSRPYADTYVYFQHIFTHNSKSFFVVELNFWKVNQLRIIIELYFIHIHRNVMPKWYVKRQPFKKLNKMNQLP